MLQATDENLPGAKRLLEVVEQMINFAPCFSNAESSSLLELADKIGINVESPLDKVWRVYTDFKLMMPVNKTSFPAGDQVVRDEASPQFVEAFGVAVEAKDV